MSTLYELSEEFVAAAAKLQELDLPDDVVADTLEGLIYPIEDKGRAIATIIANMMAEREMIESAFDRLADRANAVALREDRLRQYLFDNMRRCGITKIKHPLFDIALKKNPPKVIIDDASAVPLDYYGPQKEPPPREISKTLIKRAIDAGKEVPGAHITQEERLEIKR